MPDKAPKAPLWTRNFTTVCALNTFIFLCYQMFPAALPVYVKSLGASDPVVGWVGGVIIISTLITRPLAGLALDNLERKAILVTGLAITIVATIAYGFFPIIWVILSVRFFHGIGWGMSSTASTTIAADYIPATRFGEGMAYFSLSSSLSMAVAPALALYVGIHFTVIIAAIFIAVASILSFKIQYKQIKHSSARAPHAKMSPYEKDAGWSAVVIFLIMIAYGAMITFIAIYAISKDIANIGVYFAVYTLALLVSRPFFGKLIDSHGFDLGLLSGILSTIAALIVLAFADNLVLLLLSGIFFGVGFGVCQTTLQTMAVLHSPRQRIGAANATFFTGFDAGIGCGSVLAGFLAAYFSYSQMFLLITIFPIVALLMFCTSSCWRRRL